jgi:hypothetical protein
MKNIKKNKSTNFETFLPIFHGFYGSYWDEPDFYGEAEHFGLPENFEFWQYVNWTDYKNDLSKEFCNAVENELSNYVERIDFVELDSPQYYNFVNDKIVCIIRPKKQAIKDFIYNNKAEFEKFLERHFKSRDGFMSFYSYDFEDWKKDTKNFTNYSDYQHLGHVLQFITEQEQINEECLYEAGNNVFISNYYNNEFDEIVNGKINEIKPFIQENYTNYSNDELIELVRLKYEDENTLNIILDTAKECIKDIEDKSLKLKLA